MLRNSNNYFTEDDLADLVNFNKKLNDLEVESAQNSKNEKAFRKAVLDNLLTQTLNRDNRELLLKLAYRHSFFNRHRQLTSLRSIINSTGTLFNPPDGFSKNTIETHSQQRLREHMTGSHPDEGIKGQGYFRGIEVHFSKDADDANRQAIFILDQIRQLRLNEPELIIGLTYSANEDQTIRIRETYAKNEWNTQTYGLNQAMVITAIEKQLASDYQDLQNVFRLLPISTIPTHAEHQSESGRADLLSEDLDAIRQFANEPNHVVLGWQNQHANDKAYSLKYAVGGGVMKNLTEEDNRYIQSCLSELRRMSNNNLPVPAKFELAHESSSNYRLKK